MPTITFSLKDLENLVGKKLTIDEVQELAHHGKGDLESYSKETDELKIDFGDTNLPYLWSVEGIARLFRGILGKQKGIPKIKLNKGNYNLIVDRNISKIRPYIAAFVAKNRKVDDVLIKQIIELQEKLCGNFGKRREKIAIGIYSYEKIKFPVHYKATNPESIKFAPLDFRKEMTQQEILEEHPKGKEYAWILKDFAKYPLLIDDKGDVLSFPPIINSSITGKVEEGEENLFFECTGTELDSVLLAANIFAQALFERGFDIHTVNIKYPNKRIETPFLFKDQIKIKKEDIKGIIGFELKESEIKKLLERMQYDFRGGKAIIPYYRKDILHPVDVIEDIAISYGYNKISELPLTSYTIGETSRIIGFIDGIREILIGLGFQELMSPILTSKEILCNKMNVKEYKAAEIENYMSETYSAVRSWLLPLLMEFLSKNNHVEYPHKIFEQGLVTIRDGDEIKDYERLAVVIAHEKADFTKIKQVLDNLLRAFNLNYKIEEAEHSSFIEGRVGRVIVSDKKVAYIGEIHPQVLVNFGLGVPVAAFELNLSELFEVMGK